MSRAIVTLMLLSLVHLTQAQFISKEQALEDLAEFKALLNTQSSYFQLSKVNFQDLFTEVEAEVAAADSMPVYQLAYMLERVIAATIDRHASVKMEDFEEDEFKWFGLHLPFAVAPLDGKIVALTRDKAAKGYRYYLPEYPYLKSINGIPIPEFLERYAYRRKNAPAAAKLSDGAQDLRDIGELFFKQGELSHEDLTLVLTNGKQDKKLTLPFSERKHRWNNIGHLQDRSLLKAIYFEEEFDYNMLHTWLEDSIAYLRLPEMFSYEDYPDLEAHLKKVLDTFRQANALIVDIRGNGGGQRDILQKIAGYFVLPAQSPWVANVAFIRNDQQLDEDIESMSSRYLYSYDSEAFDAQDREAVDAFMEGFTPEPPVDSAKFSRPFYMVLKSNGNPLSCPVFLLTDEQAFSAASVFATALKGLSNVTIAGVTTNGSSGRSRKFYLRHSHIRVKLSTMISFQRNGKTLDGNGTIPDIVLPMDEAQVLGKRDTQLERLVELILE
ncbi:MAG: S41 family peptidase [Bacteroidota bacterium]